VFIDTAFRNASSLLSRGSWQNKVRKSQQLHWRSKNRNRPSWWWQGNATVITEHSVSPWAV